MGIFGLFLFIGLVFSIYRQVTNHKPTQMEMDTKRIVADFGNLRDGESIFVPIIARKCKWVVYPAGQGPQNSCHSTACICGYNEGESAEQLCQSIPNTVKDCEKGLCVDSFQRVDIASDYWVIIKRSNNRLLLQKAPS
jgi:hypothetical protein